jgi:flagellar basal-body rod modification protein FlgD
MTSSIDSLNQATTAATGKSSVAGSNDSVMGKEDFLKLLVAQLQNQDPLSPDDPTEFTAQLAQFSSLEQLFSLNKSMDNLAASTSNSDQFSTLNTIGKDVTYNGSGFDFTGEPVEIGYQLDDKASAVTMSLQQNGVTVATLKGKELETGSHFITWDGLLANNQTAPAGTYKIVMEAKATTDESIGAAPLIKSEVTGVDLKGENGPILITKAGEIAFSSIHGVYDPSYRPVATTGDE